MVGRAVAHTALPANPTRDPLTPHPHRYTPPCSGVLAVSAVSGRGLDELKAALEASVLRATGRQVLTLHVRLGGPQLR